MRHSTPLRPWLAVDSNAASALTPSVPIAIIVPYKTSQSSDTFFLKLILVSYHLRCLLALSPPFYLACPLPSKNLPLKGGEGWGPCACPGGNTIRLGSVRHEGRTSTRTSTRPPHPPHSAPCPYRRERLPPHFCIRLANITRTGRCALPSLLVKIRQAGLRYH